MNEVVDARLLAYVFATKASISWSERLLPGPYPSLNELRMNHTRLFSLFYGIAVALGCGGAMAQERSHAAVIPRLSRTILLPGVGGPVERNGIAGRLDHMAYDAATDRLFLAAFSKGSLEAIDLKQGKLIKTISGIPEAQGVAVVPEDKRVFVASGGDGTLHVYETESLESKGSAFAIEDADNVRFDARLRRILVGGGSKTQGAVVSFDPRTLVRVGEVPLPSHAESFQCDPASPRLFVNVPGDKFSDRDGIVVLADRDKTVAVQKWRLQGIARNFPMALDLSHGRVFVVGRKPARLLTLHAGTGAVLGTTPCAADSDDMFFDAAAGILFVIGGGRRVSDRAGNPIAHDQAGSLDVFSVSDHGQFAKSASIPLPPHARTGLFVPERRRSMLRCRYRMARMPSFANTRCLDTREKGISSEVLIRVRRHSVSVTEPLPAGSR